MKKRNKVRVHHEKKSDGVKVDHKEKSEGLRTIGPCI